MPSFDIVNKVDAQLLDNSINVAKREIINRFDFNGSKSEITLDKKAMVISILTEDDMRMESIINVIRQRMIKQNLNPLCLDFGKEKVASGFMIKKEVKVKEGIDKEVARKIIKDIKDSKHKVQAQMMDDQVRVTGKKIDDLQDVISLMRTGTYDLPLQFVNMK